MNAPTALDRSKFIGGSDVGAILGVSKWKTPLDLYMEKTGQVVQQVDPEREKIFRRGKRLEPIVIEMLVEERGYEIVARNERYADAEHAFMACEVDAEGMVDGEHVNLEIKTSHPFAAGQWGEEDTDEIDVSYAAQAMWGLMITGRRRCIFGVLVGSDNLTTYEVLRDEETIAGMRAAAFTFWQNNVLAGVPPAPINLPDVYTLFRRQAGSAIQATEDMLALIDRLKFVKATVKTGEGEIEDLQFALGVAMLGEKAVMQDDKGKAKPTEATPPGHHVLKTGTKELLTIRLQSQTRIDSEAVRTKHPDVAEECSKTSSFFSFNLSRKKS